MKIQTRYLYIVGFIGLHDNKKITGPHKNFDWAACSPRLAIAGFGCRLSFCLEFTFSV